MFLFISWIIVKVRQLHLEEWILYLKATIKNNKSKWRKYLIEYGTKKYWFICFDSIGRKLEKIKSHSVNTHTYTHMHACTHTEFNMKDWKGLFLLLNSYYLEHWLTHWATCCLVYENLMSLYNVLINTVKVWFLWVCLFLEKAMWSYFHRMKATNFYNVLLGHLDTASHNSSLS